MNTMTAPRPAPAPADPGLPSNYLDLYGLSKPPFGSASDGAGFILFGSHRRAFELLIDHMMNGSGLVVLTGDSGIGKTETLRAAAAVANESGLRTILVTRPPDGRIESDQIVSLLDGQPESFSSPPRKALLADDLDLMPQDCISLMLTLARSSPDDSRGSAIVVSCGSAELSRQDLAEVTALARNTIRLPRLGPAEIRQYIERSLWIAGGTTRRLITPEAMKLLVARSGGLPGSVNRLIEAAFTAGFARGDAMITAKTVGAVLGPVAPRSGLRPRSEPRIREFPGVPARAMQIAAVGLLVLGASTFIYKALSDKGLGQRLAPPRPAAVVQPPADQPPPARPAVTLPPQLMTALMKRGSEAVDLGDIAAARLLFQRAADAGNAAAATALGKTFDPSFTGNTGTRDPVRAAEWYRKAVEMGDPGAADLLKRLAPR